MKKKKVLYIISLVQKSMVFEWTAIGLKDHVDLTFILLNHTDSPLEDFLKDHGVKVKRIELSGRKNYLPAFLKTFLFMIRNRPDTVHVHLFDAQIIGLLAAKILGIEQRVYTRHNSNYHHVYHPQGIRYDRWSNQMATHIISISQATDKTLLDLEQVSASKIVSIPHGFELQSFAIVQVDRIQRIRKKWNISGNPVIGVIARHIEWKGIQYIIPAFKELIKLNPNACLILANATGPYTQTIEGLLNEIPKQNFILIPFEEDVAALYKCFDLYIHTPIDELCEAFGQTYVEALAAGIPSIFTLSGIAEHFIKHDKNAYVVPFKDSDAIYKGMQKILQDSNYCQQLIENGKQSVIPRFENEGTLTLLKKLYTS